MEHIIILAKDDKDAIRMRIKFDISGEYINFPHQVWGIKKAKIYKSRYWYEHPLAEEILCEIRYGSMDKIKVINEGK